MSLLYCGLLGLLLSGLISPLPAQASVLEDRSQAWPTWRLPAPLERPGRSDLLYPAWFSGEWQVRSSDGVQYGVRFLRNTDGSVVADRAFNATAIGKELLGRQLQQVVDDPVNPNRQLARLHHQDGSRWELESTVVGRRREQPSSQQLLVDELTLQVMHGPGDPRISRVETLTDFRLRPDERIEAIQWQATYPSPAQGLTAEPLNSHRLTFSLERAG